MSKPIVTVENLSKSYLVGHAAAQSERYKALRDVIAREARSFVRKASDMLHGRQIVQGDEIEEFWALRDVSFEVKQGEILGIIGRNGAGKSTLLKILSRVTEPTEGRVRIKGRVASLLEVGTGFHPELSGRENIFLNGAILGMTRAEIRKKFDEIIAFAGVDKFIDTPVKRYSSGMYVRLAFAVAAHLEPDVLVVDEVLAVGDTEFQKKCLGKMQDVSRREGRTVLFVSHNTSAVRSLCNRAVLLADGKVAATGAASAMADRYTADLDKGTSLEIDFSDVERIGHFGSRLRINRVRINRGEGIWHGRPLEVEFTFECLEDVEDVSFAVGFCNRDGGRVMTLDSDLPGQRWKMKRGQKGSAQLCVTELLLEPDSYTVEYGSRSGDNAGLEYFPQCGQVVVLPSEATPAVIAMRESGRGGVRFPGQWNLIWTKV